MYVKKHIKDFIKIGDVNNINSRNKLELSAPVTRLRICNSVPENVREFSISHFKKNVKKRLCVYFIKDITPSE